MDRGAWRAPWDHKELETTERLSIAQHRLITVGSSHPGIEPRSPSLQADSLPAEPQGKLKNTEEGSLSLLQADLLTHNYGRC